MPSEYRPDDAATPNTPEGKTDRLIQLLQGPWRGQAITHIDRIDTATDHGWKVSS
jgi:hypothetical protein